MQYKSVLLALTAILPLIAAQYNDDDELYARDEFEFEFEPRSLSDLILEEYLARRESPYNRKRNEGQIFARNCPVGTQCFNTPGNVCAAAGSDCICDTHSGTCQGSGYDSGVDANRNRAKGSKKPVKPAPRRGRS